MLPDDDYTARLDTGVCACGGPLERAIVTETQKWVGCTACCAPLVVSLQQADLEFVVGELRPQAQA